MQIVKLDVFSAGNYHLLEATKEDDYVTKKILF